MEPSEGPGADAAAPVSPEPGSGNPIPWEDPELPRLAAFYRTLREVLARPQAFFRGLGRDGWAEALAFALITGTVGLLACLFWGTLLYAAVSRPLAEAWGIPHVYTVGTGITIFLIVLSPVMVLFNQGFGALCLWAAVALAGAGRGLNPAWRIYNYAQGAMVAVLIPFLGAPLAGLWVLWLIYLGVQAVFQTSGWRTLGVLVLFLLLQTFFLILLLGTLLALLTFLGFLLFLG